MIARLLLKLTDAVRYWRTAYLAWQVQHHATIAQRAQIAQLIYAGKLQTLHIGSRGKVRRDPEL